MIPKSIDIIQDIEERFPVDKWTINDIYIWPLIRIELGFVIYYKRLGKSIRRDNTGSLTIITRAIESLKGFVKTVRILLFDKNTKLRFKKADVVFLSDGISYTMMGGKYYEKFCDSIKELFEDNNRRAFIIDVLYNCFSPRHSDAKNVQMSIDFILLKSTFLKNRWKRELEEYEKFIDYVEQLSKEYGFSTSFIQNIENRVQKIETLTFYFEKALSKINPKIGFVVCYYSDIAMAFIAACKNLKIKTIDIQHGVQTGDHPAYNYWGKIPREGYQLLPDFFWCWGIEEFSELSKWNNTKHLPIKGGNPFMNLWLGEKSELMKIYREKLVGISDKSKPTILLTLQFNIDDIDFIKPIIEVIRETQDKWNWWIRLHPQFMEETLRFRDFFKAKKIHTYELLLPTNLPLYSILSQIDAHVTHSSSTTIEAAFYGVKSVITSALGVELYQGTINQSMAIAAFKKENIHNALLEIFKRGHEVNSNSLFSVTDTNETVKSLLKL